MDNLPYHIPALLEPTIEGLDIKPNGTYVDCTYGGGGHSAAILQHLDTEAGGRLFAFDQDADALARAPHTPGLYTIHGNFRFLRNFLRYNGVQQVDGILADLGVSSHHFDTPQRGFSFRFEDAPLDMRMNASAARSAADIINNYDADQLARILRLYGELRQATPMARRIVAARETTPFTTTGQLIETVDRLIDPRNRKKELAQLFQALRIEVNGELDALQQLLVQSVQMMAPGARLAIITYHSLEDRMVKNFFRTGNIDGTANDDFFGRSLAPLKPLTSKAIVASQAEIDLNPRARSARLRIAQRKASSDQ